MHTFQFEQGLETLPLPSLNSTGDQIINSLQPLLSIEELTHLKQKVDDFKSSNDISILQGYLDKIHGSSLNYLNSNGISHTTGNVYGDLRGGTLPRNPFFILEDDPLKNIAPSQEFRASVLTISSLRFLIALKQSKLKPDLRKWDDSPLTMSGYHNLFGSTVIPEGSGLDIKKTLDSKHIIILSKGQFYYLEVLTEDDQIWFTKHELKEIMKSIIDDHSSNNFSLAVFTTESKTNWKLARQRLELTNKENMGLIDSALFVVCLDSESPSSDLEKIQFIAHGTNKVDSNGSQIGTCINRYYDKLNLVITKNAVAACIYPASVIDGTTALRFISDIYTDSVLRLARIINGGNANYTLWPDINTDPFKAAEKPNFKPLKFNLSNDIVNGLHLAESRLADLILQHEYICKKISKFGKSYVKDKMKLPIDSFVQICIQITYYALYGKLTSTFEPISTRKFKDARTEPICIQNAETLDICQKFISQIPDDKKWESFLSAIEKHKELAVNASNGFGFERHLSALRSSFIQRGQLYDIYPELPKTKSIPPLIFDPILDLIYKPELLVANCGNPALDFFGITPSLSTGFGIGYIIKNDSITFVASSQWRQTSRFLDTLERVFIEMKRIWKYIVVNASEDKRSTNLQKYVNSIPMSMIQSNNSTFKPIVSSSTASSTNGDGYILGGYDYFDVNQINIRSGYQSNTQSRSLTREQSKVDLKSKFINNSNNKDIGRKVMIEQDI